MSVSPLQNNSKPSPVPGPSTEISTSGFASLNFSATSVLIGSTVEEPEMTRTPPVPPPESSSLLQAPAMSIAAAGIAMNLAKRPERVSFKGSLLGSVVRCGGIPPTNRKLGKPIEARTTAR